MEKRLIIAIVLSTLVILLYQKFVAPPTPIQHPAAVLGNEAPAYEQVGARSVVQVQASKPLAEEIPAKDIETVIETEKYMITFSNIGGAVKKILLKDYNLVIFDIEDPAQRILSLNSPYIEPGLDKAVFTLKEEPNKLTYTYTNQAKNIRLRKEFIMHNSSDYIELCVFVENLSVHPIEIAYNLMGPSNIKTVSDLKGRNFIEVNAQVDGKTLSKSKIRGAEERIKGIISWVAIKNRYFVVALKPSSDCEGFFIHNTNKQLSAGVFTKPTVIQSNISMQDTHILYVGPLTKKRLQALDVGLESVINYGFFGGISVFLLTILAWINGIVHNWGVAIIVVTVLINVVLFPLTKKSFVSMQKMQELQPHMEKLKAVHKDNPQKMNKELMELYKTYNVNPFGGCLPMLLQLPIFVAFYQALMRSIELKNAHFLWIKDLSGPDALFTFSQPLPLLGQNLNILPLITLLVMVAQQRLTTAHTGKSANDEMAKQQKMMAIFFPIFFGFILYNFPSGLVLYWLTNSLLMTGEQYMLRKQMNR